MKRYGSAFLVIFTIGTLIFGITHAVRAQTPTPTPSSSDPVVQLYGDKTSQENALTNSSSDDIQKMQGRGSVSSLVEIYSYLMGTQGLVSADNQYINQVPEYMKYGLTNITFNASTDAFLQGPAMDVPHYYASMMLPKEFTSDSTTTLYAATGATAMAPASQSAQSFYSSLGIDKLWGISFSIAMVFFVIVLIVAGFLIMFRSKMGGQAVVTVSMALQNVLLGAFMSLASYALGAFFVNLSKFLIVVIAALMMGTLSSSGYPSPIYIDGPGTVWGAFMGLPGVVLSGDIINGAQQAGQNAQTLDNCTNDGPAIWGCITSGVDSFIKNAPTAILNGTISFIGGALNFGSQVHDKVIQYLAPNGLATLKSDVKNAFLSTVGSLWGLIARIIVAALLLIASIRIFWAVFQTYVKMLVDIILAPIIFLLASLPGKQNAIGAWMNRMFKNAIAPPLMFAFVNIAAYLAMTVGAGCSVNGASAAEQGLISCVTGGAMPSGGSTADFILTYAGPSAIVALILLMMVPSVPAYIDELFSGKSTGQLGKSWEGTKKMLGNIPVLGGLFPS